MPKMKPSETVVLITGASKGIGRVTAEFLQMKGYKVYGTTRYLNSIENTTFKFLELDVTDIDSVKLCVKDLLAKEGKIDVLINNAGYALCGAIKDFSTEELRQQYDTNLFGTHNMVSEILPHMLERETGRIINMGTLAGRIAIPFQGAYSSSKSALANYTDTLKMELLPTGVKVALIEPGDTRTDFNAGRKFSKNYEEDEIAKRTVGLMVKGEQEGDNPLKIAKKILKAIRSRNPKARYKTNFMQTFLLAYVFRLVNIDVALFVLRLYYNLPGKKKKT